jgi:hypothetical protein
MTAADLVARHLHDPQTSWAIGTFGAIAEFHRDPDEPVELSADGALTARGGIRVQPSDAVRIVAWERPTSGDSWTHGVALCLTADAGAMGRRTTITELGPDRDALDRNASEATLFDLGIGAPHCDACIRVEDPAMLEALRAAAGRPLLASGLMPDLAAASPTRVFVSRLGRLEVRTPIPKPDGRTPDGPHTHVLPDLLKHRRTHPATVPLPEGMVPSAEIFPASAIHDEHGHQVAFDAACHAAFQAIFAAYGDPACRTAKTETMGAVRAGDPPQDRSYYTRAQRLSRRVALRQLLHTDGPSPALTAWRAMFDRD